jgi:hypothetical protein
MKPFFAALFIVLCSWAFAQTNYYSKASGNLQTLATWGTNTDGTGTAPANFTANNQLFNIRNNNPGTPSGAWTVSGTGSRIVVGDGTNAQTFNTNGQTVTATVDVSNLGTFEITTNLTTITIGTCASGSTVSYNGDVNQSVRTGTYHHLILTGATAARTKTASGNITVNGNLTVNNNNTLDMVGNQLLGASGTISGTGTIATQNSGTTPIPANRTWSQTINYNRNNNQTIVGGTYENLNVNNISTTNARTKTASGNITVNNELLLTVSGTFSVTLAMSTFQLLNGGSMSVVAAGSTGAKLVTTNYVNTDTAFKPLPINMTWPGNVTYSGTSMQTVVPGVYTGALVSSGTGGSRTFSAMGTIEVRGAFTVNQASVTYNTSGANFLFSGNAQNLTFVGSSPFNFGRVSFTGTSVIKTIAGAGFSADTLDIANTVTLNMVTFALGGNINQTTGTGTITTQATTVALPVNKTWSQTVNFNADATQQIIGGTYSNLTVFIPGTTARTKTATADITVNNNLTFTINGSTNALTFAMSTFRLINGGSMAVVSTGAGSGGRLVTTNYTNADTTLTPLPSGQTWPGNVTYSATGVQTVVTGIYSGSLIVTGGNRTFLGNGTIEVRGAAFTANTASVTYTQSGNTNFLFASNATQTLTFISTSPFTFQNVSFTGTNASKTISGFGFGVNGTLNIASGITLTLTTFTMTGNPTVISGDGVIRLTGTGPQLPIGETWTQTVYYTSNADQQVSGGTYENLVFNGVTSGTRVKTFNGGDVTVNDTLTFNTDGGNLTFTLSTFRLIAGPSFNIDNIGTNQRNFNITSTNVLPIPSGITWPGASTSTFTFNATTDSQTVVPGTYPNVTLSNAAYKVASGDITINGVLNLSTPNPSVSLGALNMKTHVLTLGTAATITGTNDVTGTIRRTGMVHSTAYAFGNQFSTLTFQNVGTIPTEVRLRVTRGAAPTWKTNAILRSYELIQTGGVSSLATLRLGYQDTELNGNTETRLVLFRDSSSTVQELGRTENSTTNNYVELTNVVISNYPSTFGTDTITIANTSAATVEWTGTTSTAWATATNWSTNVVPDASNNIVIPDAGTTPNDPTLPATATIRRLTIEANGILNGATGAVLTIVGGDSAGTLSWQCDGTFNPSTSTVVFEGTSSSYQGITNFNNVTVQTGASLTNANGSVMQITNTFTNNGTWLVDSASSTVQYTSASAQTVINPNGVYTGYNNLTLSGSTKTLPAIITLTGNWSNSSATSAADEVIFRGTTAQQIAGSTATTFTKITNNNASETTLTGVDATITDSLKLNSGELSINGRTLNISGVISGSGNISSTALSNINITGTGNAGTLRFTSNKDSVNNFTLNRTSSGALALGSDLFTAGSTTITGGTLSIGASNSLTILGDYSATSGLLSGTSTSELRFGGTGTPTSPITFASGGRQLNLLRFNRSSATLTLGSDLTVESLELPNGILSLNGNAFTINNSYTSGGTISGSATSSLTVNGTGDFGTLTLTSGARTLNNFTLNRTASGEITLPHNLTVEGTFTLTNGLFNMGTNTLTLNGPINTNSNGMVSASGTSSAIVIGGTGAGGNLFFDQTVDTFTNRVGSFTLNRTGETVTLGGSLEVRNTLSLTNGKLGIGAGTLHLMGTLSSSATNCFVGNGTSSNLEISGTGALGSNVFFDQTTVGTTNRIDNITINRVSQTITLGNALQVRGTFTPTAGVLASGGNLTLVSDASGTARIANGGCTSCSYLTGNVTVQRFVPSVARRWRFVGSSVQSATVSDWQGETHVTGPGGAANGFDATLSNQSGIFWYNEATLGDLNQGWTAPTNTSNILPLGRGYRLFVRGDRTAGRLDGTIASQNAITLDLQGAANQGDITMPVSCTFSGAGSTYSDANDGWCLLSNPYASPYDWNAHFDNGTFNTNISPDIWILDANTTNGYLTFNANSDEGTFTGGIIPSGASFWVKATGASPTLTFKEQFKVGTTPVSVFKTNHGESFTVRMFQDSITSDAVVIKYMDEANPDYDSLDTRKLSGSVTISAYGEDSVQLATSVRPVTAIDDTIRLRVNGVNGNYSLRFENPEMLPVTDKIYLYDTHLSTVTDVQTTPIYPFTVNTAIPASTGLSRFYIVIGPTNPVPVTLLQFTARKNGEKAQLNWSTANERNSKYMAIEHSENGKSFEQIGTVAASGNSSSVTNYQWEHANPEKTNYYRLKIVDQDGTFEYSEIRLVQMDAMEKQLLVYPIPANDIITIEHFGGIKAIEMFDLNGAQLLHEERDGNTSQNLSIETLNTGVYFIKVTTLLGEELTEKIIKK